jgi:hypothetical protein
VGSRCRTQVGGDGAAAGHSDSVGSGDRHHSAEPRRGTCSPHRRVHAREHHSSGMSCRQPAIDTPRSCPAEGESPAESLRDRRQFLPDPPTPLVVCSSASTVGDVNTQPVPAASTCRICHHNPDDHVLVLVVTRPVPMGLMYCPSTRCSCGSTWRAGPSPSTRHEIEETRRLVRDALVTDGVAVPDFLR